MAFGLTGGGNDGGHGVASRRSGVEFGPKGSPEFVVSRRSGLVTCALDHHDELTSGLGVQEVLGQVGQGPPTHLLVEFRQFSTDRSRPIRSARSGQISKRCGHSLGGFVQHDGSALGTDLGQPVGSLPTLPWKEAFEHEPVGRQPAEDERCRHRRRPRHDLDPTTAIENRSDQTLAGVGHPGHTGVADQCDGLACSQAVADLPSPMEFGVLVGDEQGPLSDTGQLQESTGSARVLTGDCINGPQRFESPLSDVTEVADRCTDHVKDARRRKVARATGSVVGHHNGLDSAGHFGPTRWSR